MINYKYFLKNIDKLKYYLDDPDINTSSVVNPLTSISLIFRRIIKRIERITNLIFGDHHWYSESLAEQVITFYIARPKRLTPAQNEQIKALFNHLSHLRRGNGTYADGINSADLEKFEPKEHIKSSANTPSQHPKKRVPLSGVKGEVLLETVHRDDSDLALRDLNPNDDFLFLKETPGVDQHLLFHIHANRFGKNSSLEGMQEAKGLAFVHAYLAARKAKLPSDKTIPNTLLEELWNAVELSQIKNLSSYTKRVQEQVRQAFITNKPILIPGGWAGSPGHTIFYEVLPEGKQWASLRLYNVGEGSQAHDRIESNGKTKIQPFLEWKGISIKKLMDENIIRSIYELNNPIHNDSINYHANDIYLALEELLSPKKDLRAKKEPVPKMTSQNSGICAWKSLMAFLCTKSGKKEYKHLKCDIKIQSLINYIHELDHIKKNDWLLVKKSFTKINHSISKLYKQGLLGKRYLKQSGKALECVKKWQKTHKHTTLPKSHSPRDWLDIKKIKFDKKNTFPFRNICEIKKITKNCNGIPLEKLPQNQISTTSLPPFSFLAESFQKIGTSAELKMFSKELDDVLALCERGWDDGEDLALQTGLLDYISRLSIDKSHWQSFIAFPAEEKEAQQLVVKLGNIACFFFKTCFTAPNAHVIHSEKIHALLKIFFIQNHLFPEGFFDAFIYNITITNLFENLYFTTYQSQINQEINQLYNFIESVRRQLLIYKSNHAIGEHHLYFDLNRHPDQFSIFVKKYSPNIHETLKNNNPQFFNSSQTVQDARIYASSHLPAWIKSLRDTQLYFNYLHLDSIATPASFDRKNDFRLTFDLQKNDDNAQFVVVVVKLHGLTHQVFKDHPEIYEISNDSYKHYSLSYRPFLNLKIKQFVNDIARSNLELKEKNVLAFNESKEKYGMSIEEFRELAHPFGAKDLQLHESLEYFVKHPEKLKDLDYQILFLLLFFQPKQVYKEIENSIFAKKLDSFLKSHYEIAVANHEIQTSVFLLQMIRYFSSYSPEIQADQNRDKLHKLLEIPDLQNEEKSIIYAELAAHVADKKQLTNDEVKDLLEGTCYLKKYPLPKKWSDPIRDQTILKGMHLHATKIKNALHQGMEVHHFLLNAILKKIIPSADLKKWEVHEEKGKFPYFQSTDSQFLFYPLEGKMESLYEEEEVQIPLEIQEDVLFRKLFPTQKHARKLGILTYTFDDTQGKKIIVKKTHKETVIEKKYDNRWMRYIPYHRFVLDGSTITSPFFSRYLAENYSHWIYLQDSIHSNNLINSHKLLLLDAQIEEAQYEVDLQSESVKRLSDQTILGSPSPLLSRFEDSQYIQQWYFRNGCIAQVELPRFGLSFTFQQSINQLFCDQFKGYFIEETGILPKLGSFQHYLVLQNEKRQKKVLIPDQRFMAPAKKEALTPLYKIEKHLKIGEGYPQKYFVYDITDRGILSSSSKEANLYLVLIYTIFQKYDVAAKLLKTQGNKTTPYNLKEIEILHQLEWVKNITGDIDPNRATIGAYAGFLIQKNCQVHQKPPATDLKILEENFRDYLMWKSSVTACNFESHEEIFLLKIFLQKQFDPFFFMHLRARDPSSASELEFTIPTKNILIKKQRNLLPESLSSYSFQYKGAFVPQNPLITRIPIQKHFEFYYGVALQGSKSERKFLREGLTFAKYSPETDLAGLARFLICVLENRKKFDPILSDKQSWSSFEWEMEQLNTARGLLSSESKKILSKKTPLAALKIPPEFKSNPLPDLPPFHFSVKLSLAKEAQEIFEETRDCIQESSKGTIQKHLHLWKSGDPLKDKELNRLQDDCDIFQARLPRAEYTFVDQGLKNLTSLLGKDLNAIKEALQHMEEDLLALANHFPESSVESTEHELNLRSGIRKVLTLEELIINFGQKQPELLKKRNPALTPDEISALYSKVGDYLLLATYEQQKKRSQTILDRFDLTLNPLEKKELTQQLAAELLAERCYDPLKNPTYLVFEYFSDILMRKVQVEKLDLFLSDRDQNPVMEMIMGSGKSKVLLPLLGLLKAKEDTLSMLIVPSPLFESVSTDTQDIFQKSFSRNLYTLYFDRNTNFTKHSLQLILDDLLHIRKEKNCLVMTAKSVACLLLKFVEQFAENKEWKGLTDELKLMQKIINELSTYGHPLVDEADTVFNILHEVSFSLGKKAQPNPDQITIIAELYKILYSDASIKAIARLESDPQPDPKAPILTEQLYTEKLKIALAKAFVERMKTLKFSNAQLKEKLQGFGQQRGLLVQYLCQDKEMLKETQKFFERQDPEVQNLLALAKEEIAHLLPHTLTRTSNEKYGLDKGQVIASPFSAANAPNKGSQFANLYISQNYTFQIYIKQGVSKEVISTEIERLQQKALKELKEEGNLEKTEAWKQFSLIKGALPIPLFNQKPVHLERLQEKINQTVETKMAFVSTVILPKMEIHDQKISCNPHNLVALFRKISGFTGTLWNAASMHPKLKTIPEEGTDAKTIHLLWENSRDAVLLLKEGSTLYLLDQLFENGTFDLISDAGGYFKEESNLKVAQQMARKSRKSVVFYNERGEQAITDGKSENLLSLSEKKEQERLTFLNQSHTTGADVKQKLTAVGLVTIGRKMLLRDLLQSVWRLRGLDKAQKVVFLISQEVEDILRQILNKPKNEKIRFDDLLHFTISNQAQQQGNDNLKALKQQLWNIPQQILLFTLLSDKVSVEEQNKALDLLESQWIKPGIYPPKDLYGVLAVEKESLIFAGEEKEKCTNFIKECFTKLPFLQRVGFHLDECLKEAEAITLKLQGSLPSKLIDKEKGEDQSVEVEQEAEVETELETHVFQEKKAEKLGKTFYSYLLKEILNDQIFQKSHLSYFLLDDFLDQNKDLQNYAEAFTGISLTLNVLEWPEENPQLSTSKLLGYHRTPLHFMLVKGDKIILLSQSDAQFYKNDPRLYNLTLGYCNVNTPITSELLEKIVKVKFLNGNTEYSKEEIPLLARWFCSEGVDKMKKLYTDHIIVGFPQKAAAYAGSDLQKAFREAADCQV